MGAFQDHYPTSLAHCGRLNARGHQIKTVWDGDETVIRFTPEPYHTSVPGFAYGGLIASLVDCHSTGTAAAAMYRVEGRGLDTLPAFRFVTGSLHIDSLKPTPIDATIEIRGRVREIKGRKVVVETTVLAGGVVTARGKVVAVQMPESFAVVLPGQIGRVPASRRLRRLRWNDSSTINGYRHPSNEGSPMKPAGRTVDRKGKPVMIKLKGKVEAFYRSHQA